MGRTGPAAGSELQALASFWNKIMTGLTGDPRSLGATWDASWGRLQTRRRGSGRSRREEEGRAGVEGEAHGSVRARGPGLAAPVPVCPAHSTATRGPGSAREAQRRRPRHLVVPGRGQGAGSHRGSQGTVRELKARASQGAASPRGRPSPCGRSRTHGPVRPQPAAPRPPPWTRRGRWPAGWGAGALAEQSPGWQVPDLDPERHLLRRGVTAVVHRSVAAGAGFVRGGGGGGKCDTRRGAAV